MRPVVFGPSAFMKIAQGVMNGKQLAQERGMAEEDRAYTLGQRDREVASSGRRADLDMETLQHQILSNEMTTTAQARDRAHEAKVRADALRLRTSEFNADGRHGKADDDVDTKHDYAADYENDRKKKIKYDGLIAIGYKPDAATEIVEADFDRAAMASKASAAALSRDKTKAEIARINAQTARQRALAAMDAGGGRTRSGLNVQINDQEQVTGAADKAVPTKRPAMASVYAGKPVDQGAADAFVFDSTGRAATAQTERQKLDALKGLRGDFTAMERGGAGRASLPAGFDAQAYATDTPPGYRAWVDRKTGKAP